MPGTPSKISRHVRKQDEAGGWRVEINQLKLTQNEADMRIGRHEHKTVIIAHMFKTLNIGIEYILKGPC